MSRLCQQCARSRQAARRRTLSHFRLFVCLFFCISATNYPIDRSWIKQWRIISTTKALLRNTEKIAHCLFFFAVMSCFRRSQKFFEKEHRHEIQSTSDFNNRTRVFFISMTLFLCRRKNPKRTKKPASNKLVRIVVFPFLMCFFAFIVFFSRLPSMV